MKYRSNHVNTCNNKQACQRMKKSSIKIISVHQTSRTVEFVFTPWERYVFRSRWWAGDAVGSGQLRLVAANTSVTDGLVVSTRLVHCIRYLRGRIHAVRNCVNWSSCLQNQSVWWERERDTDRHLYLVYIWCQYHCFTRLPDPLSHTWSRRHSSVDIWYHRSRSLQSPVTTATEAMSLLHVEEEEELSHRLSLSTQGTVIEEWSDNKMHRYSPDWRSHRFTQHNVRHFTLTEPLWSIPYNRSDNL